MTWLHYPGHFAAGFAIIALVALFVFGFRAEAWRSLNWRRWLLPVIQVVPAILMLLLIWDPSYARTDEKEMPTTVLAIFDTSESMSVEDVEGADRLDKAIEMFERVFRPGAPDAPEFAVYGFDSTLHEAEAPRTLPRWGSRTSMSPVVELLQKYALANNTNAKRHIAGAVIFTDGQTVEKSAAALPAISSKDFHVTIVGVGSDESAGDVAITGIDAPARALLDTGIPVRVTFSGLVPEDASVHIELTADGVPVAMNDVDRKVLADGGSMEFTVPAQPLGPMTIEAKVGMSAPDANAANNRRQAMVNVVEEPRLNVLFYSQWANFDIGKMRQALSREKKVALEFCLDALKGAPRDAQQNANITKLPETRTAVDAYDVVVLGPVDPQALSDDQTDALYAFVAERGGGLLLLPGEEKFDLANSRNPKIKALLPGVLTPGGGFSSTSERPIDVSPEGSALGLPKLDDIGSVPAELRTYYQLEAKPASTVAATYDSTPAIVFQRVGRGHVALLNFRRLFLLYNDKDGGALRKLLSGIVTHLGASVDDAAHIQVYAERMPDDPNTILFSANVLDTQFRPSTGATVLLTIGGQAYRMTELAAGSYRAAVRSNGEETFVARVEAAKEGILVGDATTTVRLPSPSTEMDRVERNRKFLEAAADRLGGQYVDLDNLTSETASYPATSRVEVVAEVASAWRTWALLGLLCVVLSGAWFLRRMMGLV